MVVKCTVLHCTVLYCTVLCSHSVPFWCGAPPTDGDARGEANPWGAIHRLSVLFQGGDEAPMRLFMASDIPPDPDEEEV